MRQHLFFTFVGFCLLNAGCTVGKDGHRTFPPLAATAPNPAPSPPTPGAAPAPPPTSFPTIAVGEVVQFQFTAQDWACSREGGRCRSYNVTAPSNGEMLVAITTRSEDRSFLSTLEMYIVPGADEWKVGPGPQITAAALVRAGATYEIRLYSSVAPSAELELRATLTPR